MKRNRNNLYSLPKHVKKIENAGKMVWTRLPVLIALVLGFSTLDGVTLYTIFWNVSFDSTLTVWALTIGFALTLNFIPLILAYDIHCYRYRAKGIKLWEIIALVCVFSLLFGFTFYLRMESRQYVISAYTGIDPDSRTAMAYTMLLGISPLVTSAINLALGYISSDPIKRELSDLKEQRALMTEQLHVMYAAKLELEQNWEESLAALEDQRLAAACDEIARDSEQARALARLLLAQKLGDAASISELTDETEPDGNGGVTDHEDE